VPRHELSEQCLAGLREAAWERGRKAQAPRFL